MEEGVKIHPTAFVSEKSHVGEGTCIWQNCIVMDDVKIGAGCKLGANVFIEGGVVIGNRVKIKNNIAIYAGVICDDDVFLGTNCVFTNVVNPRSFIDRKSEFKRTVVKKGATIGANATVLCGHSIGRYALIGAGAVVTSDVPDYGLVLGNPARLKGYVCKCGTTLIKREQLLSCPECANQYRLNEGIIEVIKEA